MNIIKSGPFKYELLVRNTNFWIVFLMLCIIFLMYYLYQYTFFSTKWLSWFKAITIFETSHALNGLLLSIPFFYAIFFLGWKRALIIWFISLSIMLPHIFAYSPHYTSLMHNILFFLIPPLILLPIILEINKKEREKEILAARETERQAYLSGILQAQEEERRRIAQELHDDTCQSLLAVCGTAKTLVDHESGAISRNVKRQMESMRDTLFNIVEDIKRLSHDLRPAVLDDLGLLPAIRWLSNRISKMSGINIELVVDGDIPSLDHKTEIVIFRFIQEALNNAWRHSEATMVLVNLKFFDSKMKISVSDNGKGFIVPNNIGEFSMAGKLGIVGMREKAKFIDGIFNIDSEVDKGTIVSAECKPPVSSNTR